MAIMPVMINASNAVNANNANNDKLIIDNVILSVSEESHLMPIMPLTPLMPLITPRHSELNSA